MIRSIGAATPNDVDRIAAVHVRSWQAAYAEYYAADVYWPDFNKDELRRALEQFAQRERRLGLTSAQLKTKA